MAPRSGGEQFYPGPSPASPATRAPHRLQRERGEAPRQSTERDRETRTGEGWGTREESRQEDGESRGVKRDGGVDLGDTEITLYGFTK